MAALAVGGTATASVAAVCYNTGTTITLTDMTGAVAKWQSSTDSWTTINDIASSDNPLATGNLTTNTLFRAVVANGMCGPVYSSAAAVSVVALAEGGTATASAATVCYNTGTTITITLMNLTAGVEKWQFSTDNWTTINDIASTTNSLATGSLTTNTLFRAVVTNGACGPVYSSVAAVSVAALAESGTATASAPAVCYNLSLIHI